MLTQLTLDLQTTPFASDGTFPQFVRDSAFTHNKHDPIHRWVPWIAGFSASFVADVLKHYSSEHQTQTATILDPFAGVGTTLVEGLRHGHHVIGFEINPFAAFASQVKSLSFQIDPHELWQTIQEFEVTVREQTRPLDDAFTNGDDPTPCVPKPRSHRPPHFRSRVPFFSPIVEQNVLHCLDCIHEIPHPSIRNLALLALGSIIVQVSNYSYEPSLGSRVAAGKAMVLNADVVGMISTDLRTMYEDILVYRRELSRWSSSPTIQIFNQSALHLQHILPAECVDMIVTSPPYLNNYHYVRNTRPHLFWLNFVTNPRELKWLEQANFGKYWQTVRDSPPSQLIVPLPELEPIIAHIATRYPDKGAYGGRGWANYVVEYFNDCYRLCMTMQYVLKPNAVAVFVLGNSVIQGVEIATDRFFGDISMRCGLHLEGIHILREKRVGNSIINSSIRNGTSRKITLYESAVILRKPS